uniref:ATP synthase subunit a n=3 Tax=Bothrogonia TaxID=565739 RepID=A0A7D5UFK5_9HEMI|nr:ATP synthase F0 subunit 6 [Bothrogonia qiongana]YP_010247337.1 ATP synthase F0 subunit 6 [Bothrogonia shuana]AMK97240.1 ATP synthase F0 subunit 6 [Bothrogonia ferruginea]QKQ14779.1 ATP synthase F0 subunit 6 [Bothrogonia shuana]QLI54077.1 ATP synthase F0 subunit 6 [Bothrogonia qiongana]
MTNLFSTFDPCTGTLSLNWISITMMMILFPKKFWILENKSSMICKKITGMLNSELKMIMKYKGTSLIMISMFMIIFYNNIMGLMPYTFTASSHMVFSLSLALPMWVGMMIYGWVNKTNQMLIHLVPVGTPTPLMPFMVLIETISNMIRPGSLAVRLTANMIAGHILMSLLGNSATLTIFIPLMMAFTVMLLFETAVSIIQSYVFMTLMNLYSSEI